MDLCFPHSVAVSVFAQPATVLLSTAALLSASQHGVCDAHYRIIAIVLSKIFKTSNVNSRNFKYVPPKMSNQQLYYQSNIYVGQVAQSVQRLVTGWTVRGSNPGGGEIFRTCPNRPWGPPSLLYNGYRVFSGGKERPGRDADPSPPSNAVVIRVELYLYFPYGPYGLYRASVPVQGCTLPHLKKKIYIYMNV